MSAPACNVFGACVQSNPDPGNGTTTYGAQLTPGNLAYGAGVQVLTTGQWAAQGATTPAYIIEVEITGSAATGLAKDTMVSLYKDDAGGVVFASATLWMADLGASCAPTANAGGGRTYRFPITCPLGASIFAAAAVNNATVGTVTVSVRLYCNPSKPWQLSCGTSLVTIGSGGAATCAGVAVASNTAEPAYTQIGAALADDIIFLDFSMFTNDTTMAANVKFVDVALDTAGVKRIVVQNGRVFDTAAETISQSDTGDFCRGVAGDTVHARVECINAGLDSGESIVCYAIVGRYVEPALAAQTVAGVVTVGGVAVANGKTVRIHARDADGIEELVASPVTTGGTGAFTADMPEGTRTYWADYADGATLGRSADGTPEVNTFDIAIPGGGGGDVTAPTITIVGPDVDDDPGNPGAFSADWETARMTPIVVRITDVGGNRYQCLVCRYAGDTIERTVYRRGSFRGEYLGPSFEVAVANGIELHVLPVGGWPTSVAVSDVVWDIDAIDTSGNLAV